MTDTTNPTPDDTSAQEEYEDWEHELLADDDHEWPAPEGWAFYAPVDDDPPPPELGEPF